jgi:hypothetical protein
LFEFYNIWGGDFDDWFIESTWLNKNLINYSITYRVRWVQKWYFIIIYIIFLKFRQIIILDGIIIVQTWPKIVGLSLGSSFLNIILKKTFLKYWFSSSFIFTWFINIYGVGVAIIWLSQFHEIQHNSTCPRLLALLGVFLS